MVSPLDILNSVNDEFKSPETVPVGSPPADTTQSVESPTPSQGTQLSPLDILNSVNDTPAPEGNTFVPQDQSTIGQLSSAAGSVIDKAPQVAQAVGGIADSVTRGVNLTKEALFNAGKSVASIPGEILQGASNILLQAFGVDPGGDTVNERITAATGVDKLFESDFAKKLIPIVQNKSDIEKFASKAIQLGGESVAFYATGLAIAGKMVSKADKLKATESILKEAAKTDLGKSFLRFVLGSTKATAKLIGKETLNTVKFKSPTGAVGAFKLGVQGATGGEAAKRAFPDSPLAEFGGNLVAQIGPSILRAATLKVLPKSFRETTLAQVFPEEANAKIIEDLRKGVDQSGGLKAAEQNVASAQRTTGVLNKAAEPLPGESFKTDLASSTGNPLIVAEKRRVTQGLPETNPFTQQERVNKKVLNDAVDSITPNADISISRAITKKQVTRIDNAIDLNIRTIKSQINKASAKQISPLNEQISGIKFRDDIVEVRHLHNKAANTLYSRIDRTLKTNVNDFFESNNAIVEKFKGAPGEADSISAVHREIASIFENGGGEVSMGKVVDIRKLLTNELRDVSKGATPSLSKAKFIKSAIDSLDTNLNKIIKDTNLKRNPELTETINRFKRARNFVRKNKMKFNQGIVAKILATETQGDFRLTDTQILPAIIQAKGINPDFVDKTLKVIKGRPVARKLLADHVRKTSLLPKGQGATTKSLDAFMKLNNTAIEKLPGLKKDLQSILTKKIQLDAKLKGKTKIDSSTNSFRASANLLLGQKPEKVMKSILDSPDPVLAIDRAVKIMGNNADGVSGLKNAFIQDFKNVTGGDIKQTKKLKKFLENNKPAFDRLFKDAPDSKKVLNAVADGASIVERGGIVKTGQPSLSSDNPIGSSISFILAKTRILMVDKVGPAIFGTLAAKNILETGSKIGQKTVDSLLAITLADNNLAKTMLKAAKSKSDTDIRAFASALATAFNLDGKENR